MIVVKHNRKTILGVESGRISIGSRQTCSLTLLDPLVSPRHAELWGDGDGFYVCDTGSLLGTFVNGKPPGVLKSGDVIEVGNTKLVVKIGEGNLELDLKYSPRKAKLDRQKNWIRTFHESFRESEISFSGFPALWFSVWTSLIVGSAMGFYIWGNNLFDPGPLHLGHQEASCFDCHQSWGNFSCLGCHSEINGTHGSDTDCTFCHVEHQGNITRKPTCQECHETKKYDVAPPATKRTKYKFNNFSHLGHSSFSCMDCHEFPLRYLGFKKCMGCHEYGEHGSPIFMVLWHGSGDECLGCHENLFKRGLKTSKGKVSREFVVKRRPHTQEDKEECRVCHKKTDRIHGGSTSIEKFRHELHRMPCSKCHRGIQDSVYIGDFVYIDVCEECHNEIHEIQIQTEETQEFPHNEHSWISCMDCHDKNGKTLINCDSCHDKNHDQIGGGDCAHCHSPEDYSNPKMERIWPVNAGFSHESPGHMVDCLVCHSNESSCEISSMRIPRESDEVCVDCHINEGARFHWRK